MRYFKLLQLSLLTLVVSTCLISQSASVELIKSSDKDYKGLCYDIEVTLQEGEGRLSSQNYRLYYDASTLKFDRRSAYSTLTTEAYNPLKVVQAVHNSNASGYGNLNFSSHIGYINMTITDDVNFPSTADTKSGIPLKTATFCFQVLANATSGAIVWARNPLTKGYASAFTELSLLSPKGTVEVLITDYTDIQEHTDGQRDKLVDIKID